jgi:hypothetical protein
MSDTLDEDLFRIVTYLVASASLMPDVTLELASLVQLEVAERLIAMADASSAFTDDPFLAGVRRECATHKEDVMHDPIAFRTWINDLLGRVVVEARRHNSNAMRLPGSEELSGRQVVRDEAH